MGWSEVLSFVLVAALLVMTPGPNGVLVARTVPTSGRLAGFANIAGFVAAFFLHGALAILGLSIILVQSAVAFTIVKYLGAAYLCWIGAKALWAACQRIESDPSVAPARTKRTLRTAFTEGLLTNALNPKVSMFYLAAFPQFITIGQTSPAAGFLLVSVHAVLNAIWFGAMVMLLAKLTNAARNVKFQRWLRGVTGVVFIAFGAKLAAIRPDV